MMIVKRYDLQLLRVVLAAALFFLGCKEKRPARQVERAFYFWKSAFYVDQSSKSMLNDLNITKLYVKFFDVSWNPETRQPMPLAIINLDNNDSIHKQVRIVPTVFITNECIEKMDTSQVREMAERINRLIEKICNSTLLGTDEIQIDCDWNGSTKSKYFALLKNMRQFTTAANKLISATIRLYQCKYYEKAGVPPVDRGLLMCYNMGNLKNPSTTNSILEPAELKKYIAGLTAYPLPLDVALPLFDWKVLFRNNVYRGLVSALPSSALVANPAVKVSGRRYTILSNITLNGYDLKAGDMLRDEEVKFEELLKAADDLSMQLKAQAFTLSLYHLDSLTLSKYSLHELETIFDHLR